MTQTQSKVVPTKEAERTHMVSLQDVESAEKHEVVLASRLSRPDLIMVSLDGKAATLTARALLHAIKSITKV
jgi:hypothetical protein